MKIQDQVVKKIHSRQEYLLCSRLNPAAREFVPGEYATPEGYQEEVAEDVRA